MFRLEINDPTEAEELISQNLVCQVTSVVYEREEFQSPVSVKQCYNCQSFAHLAKNFRSKQKCFICGDNHSHKDARIEKQENPNVLIVRDHMLHLTKGVQKTKKKQKKTGMYSGNMWSITKSHMPQLSAKTLCCSLKL